MKSIFPFILSILVSIGSQVSAQIVETHEFGSLNTSFMIYSDGRTWKFAAQNTMAVKYLEVKSVLASRSHGIFHIEISIEDSLIANWDKLVYNWTYDPYIHTEEVTYSLAQGDTICYKIYGNYFWTAAGGLLGINHVKLYDQIPTDVELVDTAPSEFMLSQNYPNPFNPDTTISYRLAHTGIVNLSIYDISGRKVATLVDCVKTPGEYSITWNAKGFASGLYFCTLKANGVSETRKMLLMK